MYTCIWRDSRAEWPADSTTSTASLGASGREMHDARPASNNGHNYPACRLADPAATGLATSAGAQKALSRIPGTPITKRQPHSRLHHPVNSACAPVLPSAAGAEPVNGNRRRTPAAVKTASGHPASTSRKQKMSQHDVQCYLRAGHACLSRQHTAPNHGLVSWHGLCYLTTVLIK